MPHGIEYIVRPFQSPGSLGNTVIPATPKPTAEQAHLVWGGKGTMPSTKLLNPSTVVTLKREDLTEIDRDNDSIRITGDDGESFVDVDRARTVRLTKKEMGNDQSLGETDYATQDPPLDLKLAPYLQNFHIRNATNTTSSGSDKVTWYLLPAK